jgi:tetratricopeptide (TPR) repeat protein
MLFSLGITVQAQTPVTIEEKPLVLPTYRVAPPDKNPVFYTGRVYQGAQGHIYPHALNDVLTDDRKDQTYQAVYLNNEFLELCVVPELGGRIFSALDKTDQYDFFYRQHVIKPALIGMTGAWISGGVEWNIPDHHRATSQAPIDYTMVENPDGSKTAWVGETELTRGLKWMVGLTVRPGKSYIEATVRVFNPTSFIHPFLYWANVSVHCDENYQVIFPPSTQFGVQHAKGEFTPWPIGDGMYGGVDRTGVDLSWWKNHPNPASIFAWNFTDDFLAGYDYKKDAGTVHVANHHVVTGKKFFLWGNNDEAKMYEKVLTEKDGQYLELMVGAFSDNQPDYSWIAPGETKTFTQFWYPVKKIGGVKNANTNAAVNLERKTPASVKIGLCTTADFRSNKIVVTAGGKTILEETKDLNPASPYLKEIAIDPSVKDNEIKVALYDKNGVEQISYSPVTSEKEDRPKPIEVPKSPKEYGSVEELYLTGLRIEQFRNAIIDPMPYYKEALSRDSMDYRVNTVLGIRYCKEGQYGKAEEHLRKAISRITKNYTRPKDGEANYYLGIVLQLQNKFAKAADEFWKATWDNGFQAVAYFRLAQLACLENNYLNALSLVDQSLAINGMNTAALTFKAFVLRKTGRLEASEKIVESVESMDKLDHWGSAERYFLNAEVARQRNWTEKDLNQFKLRMGGNVQNALELARRSCRSAPFRVHTAKGNHGDVRVLRRTSFC